MPDALSFAEIDGQYLELLPARTVLSVVGRNIYYGNGNDGGPGGIGGDGGTGGNALDGGTGGNANGGGSGGDSIVNKDVGTVERGKG